MSKANIKATINANIKQNGNQEITGAILNSVMNAVVDNYADQDEVTEIAQKVHNLEYVKEAIKKGDNLFDYNSSANELGHLIDGDGNLIVYSSYNVTHFIDVVANTQYIANFQLKPIYFKADKTFLSQGTTTNANVAFTAPTDAVYMRCNVNRGAWIENGIINEGNVLTTNTKPYKLSESVDIEDASEKLTILEVGTGKTFTSLVTAINSITNPSKRNRFEIHLFEGTYNTIVTSQINNRYIGLQLPDYVDIIGYGNRANIIIAGSCPTDYATYANNISTLNVNKNNVIENVTIEGRNVRYCVHDDEYLNIGYPYKSKHIFRDCVFKMTVSDTSTFDVSGVCYGIGGEKDKEVVFENCDFIETNTDNNSRTCLLFHDNASWRGLRVIARGCKFNGGRWNVQARTTNGTIQCFAVFEGCYFGGFTQLNAMRIYSTGSITNNIFKVRAFANKDFSYLADGNLSGQTLDVDIY